MNSDEQAVVDFALMWEPYDGPPAGEVLVAFGLTLPAFRARVRSILMAPGTLVDRPLRQHARTVLQSYLDEGSGPRPAPRQIPGPPRRISPLRARR